MITEAGAPLTSNEGACPDGYTAYGPSCYRYFPPNAAAPSWSTAQQVCKDNSAQLVEISSVYEDGFVQALVADSAPNGYWIGLADTTVCNTPAAVKSVTFSYSGRFTHFRDTFQI